MTIAEIQPILQQKLQKTCSNVYFEPPESVKLKYPCILYYADAPFRNHGNNTTYITRHKFNVTIKDRSALSTLPDRFEEVFGGDCNLDRHFVDGDLHQWSYTLYFH